MKIDIVKQRDNLEVAVIHSDSVIIKDVSSALDFIMGVKYETGCTNIAINKGAITDDFFVLSTCLAGEILQKFINYGIRFAIYGDFSHYTFAFKSVFYCTTIYHKILQKIQKYAMNIFTFLLLPLICYLDIQQKSVDIALNDRRREV